MMFSGWCGGQQNKGKRRFFYWKNAKLVEPEKTQQITLRVKKSVLEGFKATGKSYQNRMNAAPESFARTLGKE